MSSAQVNKSTCDNYYGEVNDYKKDRASWSLSLDPSNGNDDVLLMILTP